MIKKFLCLFTSILILSSYSFALAENVSKPYSRTLENVVIDLTAPIAPTTSNSATTQTQNGNNLQVTVNTASGKGVWYACVTAYLNNKKEYKIKQVCGGKNSIYDLNSLELPSGEKGNISEAYVEAEKEGKTAGTTFQWTSGQQMKAQIIMKDLADTSAESFEDHSASGTDNDHVAPIETNFPQGNSSINLEAVRISRASSSKYGNKLLTPVGGVTVTIDILTNYKPNSSQQSSMLQTEKAKAQTSGTSQSGSVGSSSGASQSDPKGSGSGTSQSSSTGESSGSGTSNSSETQGGPGESTNAGTSQSAPSGSSGTTGASVGGTSNDSPTSRTENSRSLADKLKDTLSRFGANYRPGSFDVIIPDNGQASSLTVEKLPPGRYTLAFNKEGFKHRDVYFELKDNEKLDIKEVKLEPRKGAEPPSINTNLVARKSATNEYFAQSNGKTYMYVPSAPWQGWQTQPYNYDEPVYDAEGNPSYVDNNGNPNYNTSWGNDYWGSLAKCQSISASIPPGINPGDAATAAGIFGLLGLIKGNNNDKDPITIGTSLEKVALPALGVYYGASAIENSGASFSVTQVNEKCPQLNGSSPQWNTPPQCSGCGQPQVNCLVAPCPQPRCDSGCNGNSPLSSIMKYLPKLNF